MNGTPFLKGYQCTTILDFHLKNEETCYILEEFDQFIIGVHFGFTYFMKIDMYIQEIRLPLYL